MADNYWQSSFMIPIQKDHLNEAKELTSALSLIGRLDEETSDPKIIYKKGPQNAVADALSRMPSCDGYELVSEHFFNP